MSFVAGNFDKNGNAFLMVDTIAIGEGCFTTNTKVAHYNSEKYGDIYCGFSGTASECELMIQSFSYINVDFNAPKYILIKNINEWADEFFSSYNLMFDDCSFIFMVNNRFIVFKYYGKDIPYEIYITDYADLNKNTIAIGAGVQNYFHYTKLFDETKYSDLISFEEIFKLITYKNVNTKFPVYKINPVNKEVIVYNDFDDEGTSVDIDKFNFVII